VPDANPTGDHRRRFTLPPGWPQGSAVLRFDASVTRVVYDARGAVLHTDTFNSHYIVVTGITQVGPTPEPPPIHSGKCGRC